jgi:pilus assembly protein Flp/PilA
VKKLVSRLRDLRARRDRGASAVEYGLLVALIAVVIAGAVYALGTALDTKFDNTKNCVESANTGTSACP